MLLVGCSGFPVPATRYLREFEFVEISDTHIGVPGPALVRRWKREAPLDFAFAAMSPREIGLDGFKPSAASDAAWETFLPVARDLAARFIVVVTPPELPAGKANRAAVRLFFERVARPKLPPAIWEPPATWELREAEATVKDLRVTVARDPARHPPFAKTELAYYRLNGPAGHKSRYEDATLEAAAKTVRDTAVAQRYVVFTNVDMYSDARRMRKLLED